MSIRQKATLALALMALAAGGYFIYRAVVPAKLPPLPPARPEEVGAPPPLEPPPPSARHKFG